MAQHPTRPALRVLTAAELTAAEDRHASEGAAIPTAPAQPDMTQLAAFIRNQFDAMRRHRDNATSGWSERLLSALRVFNGQYSASQLAEIKKFGGSEVFARIVAAKCRAASSLLRDVYLSPDRAWAIAAGPDPDIPQAILETVRRLVAAEAAAAGQAGVQISDEQIRDRMGQLEDAARQAAKKRAARQATVATDKVDELLVDGGFYRALADFLADLPIFPYACIKGPTVRIVQSVKWAGGKATTEQVPKLFWDRISPFDIYWTPGVAAIEDANTIERLRLTRADLNDLLDLPGYDHEAIRSVLQDYSNGLLDTYDQTDTQRADYESRENPHLNTSGIITALEFHGNVQGLYLLQWGMEPGQIPDPLRDYFIQAWLVGRYVIKVQLSPSPRKRHPYYVTSYEMCPGSPVGNALPDIIEDIQTVCNGLLRAIVNNASIASGPQVVVTDDRLGDDEDGDELYPWKRWHVKSDPFGSANTSNKPVEFFSPDMKAQELFSVYSQFTNLADELSAIPRYMTGAQAGAVGRTASGLAMLMGNASKLLQTVAANIDRDIFDPVLRGLYDILMLTDTSGMLRGDESIKVMGVQVAVQKETQRSRQLEFLQTTANQFDMQIVGPRGRAAVLRSVAQTIGMAGEQIVPSDEDMEAQQKLAAQRAQESGIPGHAGFGDAAQGEQAGGGATADMGPRTNLQQRISGGIH